MKEKLRSILFIIGFGLIVGGLAGEYGPVVIRWLPVVGPSGPVDYVWVIEESGERTAEQAAVILGPLSRELRKAGKWRKWDKDEVPVDAKPIVDRALKDRKLPFILLLRGGRVVAGPVAVTKEADLRDFVERNGGY